MQWRPIETAPKDVRIIVYINDPSGRAISFGRVHGFVADGEPYMSIDGFGGGWRVTHWLPAPTAPAIEARRAENAVAGSVEDESAVAEGQAPVNHVLLSALKAMDKALTDNWVFPSDEVTRDMIGEETCKAWIQIRSAISKADRE
ncbi:hypothetical protein [Methylobacterium sp. yr596]|uniref:hypothetical protein n=1 Tax=Methylobacterium sp. yr596 TaxID=1761800 RepID=UPI000B88F49B|nr:hypothetical protein [Methylobacterium sp. yr596]